MIKSYREILEKILFLVLEKKHSYNARSIFSQMQTQNDIKRHDKLKSYTSE